MASLDWSADTGGQRSPVTPFGLTCPCCGHEFTPKKDEVFVLGPLRVGMATGLTISGNRIHLQPKQLMMLTYLARHHPRPCSRDSIMDACNAWGTPKIVCVMAYNIRLKIAGTGVRLVGEFMGWWHEGHSYYLDLGR